MEDPEEGEMLYNYEDEDYQPGLSIVQNVADFATTEGETSYNYQDEVYQPGPSIVQNMADFSATEDETSYNYQDEVYQPGPSILQNMIDFEVLQETSKESVVHGITDFDAEPGVKDRPEGISSEEKHYHGLPGEVLPSLSKTLMDDILDSALPYDQQDAAKLIKGIADKAIKPKSSFFRGQYTGPQDTKDFKICDRYFTKPSIDTSGSGELIPGSGTDFPNVPFPPETDDQDDAVKEADSVRSAAAWGDICSIRSTDRDEKGAEVAGDFMFESYDSEYLKNHLGIPLTLALAEIVAKKPSDPIHYLGHWLFKWRYNQERRQTEIDKVNELICEKERLAEEEAEKKRLANEEIARSMAQSMVEAATDLVDTAAFDILDAAMSALEDTTGEGVEDIGDDMTEDEGGIEEEGEAAEEEEEPEG